MGVDLDGPVGLRARVGNVRNLASDQGKIIGLLASIPEWQGGKQSTWSVPPLAGASGQCPQLLANAIWDFQVYWRQRGVFHIIDGVVDPHGHTLRQLNALASGAPAPGPPPGGLTDPPAAPDAPDYPLKPVISRLQRTFGYRSSWIFTSSSSVNVSVAVMGGGIGVLFLQDTDTNAQRRIVFGGLGGSFGPLPAGVSWSTPNMPSQGVGRLYTREELPLDLSDLNGPAIIMSVGAVTGVGGGMSIYLLGVTNTAGWLGAMMPAMFGASLLNAAANAKAMGTMVGDAYGLDIGAGIWQGMAVSEKLITDLFG